MESYLISSHFDLITPDGIVHDIRFLNKKKAQAWVKIKNISPAFVGFSIDPENIFFNLKSSLAQLGINGVGTEYELNQQKRTADIQVQLVALNKIGEKMLSLLTIGCFIGKLFAADERRKVKNPDYLTRMFGRCDQHGKPLLSLGNLDGPEDLILEKINGYTIAFLSLKKGLITYSSDIYNFLPTLAKMLQHKHFHTRELLHLNQSWEEDLPTIVHNNQPLLVRTAPLHIRTVFANVVEDLLPKGYHHTSASVLQPDTEASGDIYEFFGSSNHEITDVPLEFYTLEPHREYVFFTDRDQLQTNLENSETLFHAFDTAPKPQDLLTSIFLVKGSQIKTLSEKDWISREGHKLEFPGMTHPSRQALLVEKYIEQQPSYPFLKAIEDNLITSQGVLLSRYFPSPLMKRLLINESVQRCIKRIYFQYPSRSHGYYFSHEDRAFLLDLAKFALPVFWVDDVSKKVLQYVVKPEKDTGMFVPLELVETFRKATFFGVYGSNLFESNFEQELEKLLQGVLELKKTIIHPLISQDIPLALLTGGGPGAMEVGNRIAKKLHILSCGNIMDFQPKDSTSVINEQKQNPHIEAKMTYRIDRLVERQAEFHLDFPIFMMGGIGTDFEYTLEEVRKKVGSVPANPIILFGEKSYWQKKLSSQFQCNLESGTIKGSEWVSNCFYSIQKAEEGLLVYRLFLEGKLSIGKGGPVYPLGFCDVATELAYKDL